MTWSGLVTGTHREEKTVVCEIYILSDLPPASEECPFPTLLKFCPGFFYYNTSPEVCFLRIEPQRLHSSPAQSELEASPGTSLSPTQVLASLSHPTRNNVNLNFLKLRSFHLTVLFWKQPHSAPCNILSPAFLGPCHIQLCHASLFSLFSPLRKYLCCYQSIVMGFSQLFQTSQAGIRRAVSWLALHPPRRDGWDQALVMAGSLEEACIFLSLDLVFPFGLLAGSSFLHLNSSASRDFLGSGFWPLSAWRNWDHDKVQAPCSRGSQVHEDRGVPLHSKVRQFRGNPQDSSQRLEAKADPEETRVCGWGVVSLHSNRRLLANFLLVFLNHPCSINEE